MEKKKVQKETKKETKREQKKRVETYLQGVVVSTKMDKTVAVSVERIFQHPMYKKIMRKRKKFLAHDEKNKCKIGDVVRLKLIRPLSKRKRWLIVDIVSQAQEKEVAK